jgi:hypothetical protein
MSHDVAPGGADPGGGTRGLTMAHSIRPEAGNRGEALGWNEGQGARIVEGIP